MALKNAKMTSFPLLINLMGAIIVFSDVQPVYKCGSRFHDSLIVYCYCSFITITGTFHPDALAILDVKQGSKTGISPICWCLCWEWLVGGEAAGWGALWSVPRVWTRTLLVCTAQAESWTDLHIKHITLTLACFAGSSVLKQRLYQTSVTVIHPHRC